MESFETVSQIFVVFLESQKDQRENLVHHQFPKRVLDDVKKEISFSCICFNKDPEMKLKFCQW